MKIINSILIVFLVFSMVLGLSKNFLVNKKWFREFKILQHMVTIITVMLLFVFFYVIIFINVIKNCFVVTNRDFPTTPLDKPRFL